MSSKYIDRKIRFAQDGKGCTSPVFNINGDYDLHTDT